MKETDLYKARMLAKNFFEMIISKAEMLLVIVRHLFIRVFKLFDFPQCMVSIH